MKTWKKYFNFFSSPGPGPIAFSAVAERRR